MKVLVINDDGVNAPGLWAAVDALSEVAQVVVVVPDREQSGVGTSVTLHGPLRVAEVISRVDGVPCYTVEGTPGDSAILALEVLVGTVDLVVSGINSGANLGEDVLVSGTVGGALHGYFRGITAIAISVTALRDVHFQAAAALLKLLVRFIERHPSQRPVLLNINLPNVPPDKIEGVAITTMGQRSYMDVVREDSDERHKYYWIARTKPVRDMVKGTDIWAVRHNRISITPIQTDMTSLDLVHSLEPLGQEIERGLRGD